MKNRQFADKLDKLLHGCGKHTLRYLEISSKPLKNPELRLRVYDHSHSQCFTDCEFPETEMPENIKSFKRLIIEHLDDEALGFLTKIKPLFTNAVLDLVEVSADEQSATNARIILGHLLPMFAGIRAIRCNNDDIELLKRHFPGTLARAKELELDLDSVEPAFFPVYLDWLNAPLNFDVHGPRFLRVSPFSGTIVAMVDAIHQQFLAATTSATFVIFIRPADNAELHYLAEGLTVQNATTKEQLTARNHSNYVEIMRYSIDADVKMRAWIEQHRAHYEKQFFSFDEAERVISISSGWLPLTIGHITKKDEIDQAEDETDGEQDEAGPSTSAKK